MHTNEYETKRAKQSLNGAFDELGKMVRRKDEENRQPNDVENIDHTR